MYGYGCLGCERVRHLPKDVVKQSPEDIEIGELHDRINNLEFLNKVITSDMQRSNVLLKEVLAQLYTDKDEYHAELHDKIVKELGE